MLNITAVILAGGNSSRMISDKHKTMHFISGKTIFDHIFTTIEKIIKNIIIISSNKLYTQLTQYLDKSKIYIQDNPYGNGDALNIALQYVKTDYILAISCDTPLISENSLNKLIHNMNNNDGIVGCADMNNVKGYGRIHLNNNKLQIIETPTYFSGLVNSGIYIFKKSSLNIIDNIYNENNKEVYITSLFKYLNNVNYVTLPQEDILGVNTLEELQYARQIFNKRILSKHTNNGIEIIDPNSTWIDINTKIKQDVTILPTTFINNSIINSNSVIGPATTINNTNIGFNTIIKYSYIEGAIIGSSTQIGPFSHIRAESNIKNNCKIGAYTEIKKSTINNNSKVPHLAYVGNATIDSNSNVGAGAVFANYNGKIKQSIHIGKNVMIGSNTTLIAPITIKDDAYIAGGSVITNDVEEKELSIGRATQKNIKRKQNKKND